MGENEGRSEGRYQELGEFIEQRIKALGLAKGEVADSAGITTQTLREIEQGLVRRRSPRTWAGVERALYMPPGSARRVLDGEWTAVDLTEATNGADDRHERSASMTPVERQLVESASATLAAMQEMLSMQREIRDALREVLEDRRPPA